MYSPVVSVQSCFFLFFLPTIFSLQFLLRSVDSELLLCICILCQCYSHGHCSHVVSVFLSCMYKIQLMSPSFFTSHFPLHACSFFFPHILCETPLHAQGHACFYIPSAPLILIVGFHWLLVCPVGILSLTPVFLRPSVPPSHWYLSAFCLLGQFTAFLCSSFPHLKSSLL